MATPSNFDANGVLLVGHGTRSAAGIACVGRLRDLVADRLPGVAVEHCFLELHPTTVAVGLNRLTAVGVSDLVVGPILLFDAGHGKTDIPAEVRSHLERANVRVRQSAALGLHPALIELSQRRFDDALQGRRSVAPERTCLLLVGRGSRDQQATAAMRELAQLRNERLPGVTVEVGFIAMAEPGVARMVDQVAGRGYERIVVQPHLLFPGELLDDLGRLIERQRRDFPQSDWLLAAPLAADVGQGGPADVLLVDAVVGRIRETLA